MIISSCYFIAVCGACGIAVVAAATMCMCVYFTSFILAAVRLFIFCVFMCVLNLA